MEKDQHRYLGIDIGGTSAKHALINGEGRIIQQDAFHTGLQMSKDQFLQRLFSIADCAIQDAGIYGIGISTMGVVDPMTGTILGGTPNMPSMAGLPLGEILHQRYPQQKVSVINDVKAMAYGEMWRGAAKGRKNFFSITLGAGLGGCIVIDGRVLDGIHFRAGEICYLDYSNEGEYLEKYTSTKYVLEKAAKFMNITHLNGFEFFEYVKNGNIVCKRVLEEWMQKISRLIANVIILLDPEMVVIGGGISNESSLFLPYICNNLANMLPPEFCNQTEICTAKCKNQAGMLGAISTLIKPE